MADGGLDINATPTKDISVREVFGIDTDMTVKGFEERTDRVPDLDSARHHRRQPSRRRRAAPACGPVRRASRRGVARPGPTLHVVL